MKIFYMNSRDKSVKLFNFERPSPSFSNPTL